MRAEQRRARCPDESGEVTRAGVPLHFDVYGAGATTLLLLPAWSIVDSRFWKAQVPFLARHHRVVTFDGRGSGRSGRPRGAEAFMDREFVADALAVLDATRTDRSVLIGYSRGATWAVQLAAAYPQRVLGVFAIAPACLLPAAAREGDVAWLRTDAEPDGWGLYNRHHWLTGRDSEFKRFYFSEMFPEPHSTKQIEDMLVWSADIDARRRWWTARAPGCSWVSRSTTSPSRCAVRSMWFMAPPTGCATTASASNWPNTPAVRSPSSKVPATG
ncbi:alpha/beta hydrolase [Mycolicibacterium elephantis]